MIADEKDIALLLGLLIIWILVRFSEFIVTKFFTGKKTDHSKKKKIDIKFLKKTYEEYTDKIELEELYLTPVQAGYLLENTVKYNHVVATILHFLDLRIITLKKIKKEDGTVAYRFEKNDTEFCNYYNFCGEKISEELIKKANKKKISLSEIFIIDRIVFKYYNYVNADRIYLLYDGIDDYSKLYNLKEINEIDELKVNLSSVSEVINDEFEKIGILKKHNKFDKNSETTKLGFAKKYSLYKYMQKIKNDTLLPERSIENVHLWGEHLIYGVAFNVCKTVIKDAKDIYEGKRKK